MTRSKAAGSGPSVGTEVKALRMKDGKTTLDRGVVIVRATAAARVEVRFRDGVVQSYSGRGIADYLIVVDA